MSRIAPYDRCASRTIPRFGSLQYDHQSDCPTRPLPHRYWHHKNPLRIDQCITTDPSEEPEISQAVSQNGSMHHKQSVRRALEITAQTPDCLCQLTSRGSLALPGTIQPAGHQSSQRPVSLHPYTCFSQYTISMQLIARDNGPTKQGSVS